MIKQKLLTSVKSVSGFTIIEVLVYSVGLSIVAAVVVAFVFQTLGVTETSRRIREATDNARRSLEIISQEVRHAKTVYTPTSSFGISPGQLSLETLRDVAVDEKTTYADFYVDNQGLFLKREDQSAQLLTSEKVKVTNLVFTDLNGTNGRDAIKIDITVIYNDPISGPANKINMSTTAVLRSY